MNRYKRGRRRDTQIIAEIPNWPDVRARELRVIDTPHTRRRLLANAIDAGGDAAHAIRNLVMGSRGHWQFIQVNFCYDQARADARTVGEWIDDGAPDFDPLKLEETKT